VPVKQALRACSGEYAKQQRMATILAALGMPMIVPLKNRIEQHHRGTKYKLTSRFEVYQGRL